MKLYMIRHGETELNRDGCYYGMLDAKLTDRGRDQALKVGQALGQISFDRIFVSPLARARETVEWILSVNAACQAARTGDNNNNELIQMDQEGFFQEAADLCEQNFGIFEGMTYRAIMEQYPLELEAWNRDFNHYVIPEGESFAMVRARVEHFLADLKAHNYGREEKLLLVAHKGTLGHMLAAMLGLPLEGYWNFTFEQGCVNQVDLEDGYAIIRKINALV